MSPRTVTAWLVLAGLTACESPSTTIDPFPVAVDLSAGPVLSFTSTATPGAADLAPLRAIIDTMSPLTIVDSFAGAAGEVPDEPRRRRVTLSLLGVAPNGTPGVPRARWTRTDVLDLHPCGDATNPGINCAVGNPGVARSFRSIIGADLLAGGAVRFDFPASELRFLPYIAGDDIERSDTCDAVLGAPFHGGGTLLLGGAEISFPGRRLIVGSCAYDVERERQNGRIGPNDGVDGTFVVSTGLGLTIIGESSYRRFQQAGFTAAAPYEDLPTTTLFMPFGGITVRTDAALSVIENLALIGEADDTRGPCTERYANYFFYKFNRCGDADADHPCPCVDNNFCRTAAIVELTNIQVAVVADGDPLLQALRTELRPDLPEIDGILGVNALAPLVMDVDYPNARLLFRCEDGCAIRPALLRGDSAQSTGACPGVLPPGGFPAAPARAL